MKGKNIISVRISSRGEKRLKSGHPWIFKSDIVESSSNEAGLAVILNKNKKFLASAFYSPSSQITLRILSRKEEKIDCDWFATKIKSAIELRKKLNICSNSIRIIYGESDGLPAVIADKYDDVISFQTLCAGVDVFRNEIINALSDVLKPSSIIERNDAITRKAENLPRRVGVVAGTYDEHPIIKEDRFSFLVDVLCGQKTGAYLDQRDNRILAGKIAYGSVLDCFSYEGWFGVHMSYNAKSVLCVDSSAQAVSNAQKNIEINGLKGKVKVLEANVFDFLKAEDQKGAVYDCINLDPPPFVKSIRNRESGFRGYKEINLRAMKILRRRGGLLFTSSCSYNFSEDDFDVMLANAALDAKVNAKILYRRNAAADHPNLTTFPESNYLKFRVLYISS